MSTACGGGRCVFVGTYTGKGSAGVYRCRFEAGRLSAAEPAAELPNPTYLTLHPNRRFLYAVSEERDTAGRHNAAATAFAIVPETGELRPLNRQSTRGDGPCHATIERTGRFLLVANYAGGSVAMLPIESDGRLSEASDVIRHQGRSVHPERQKGPHAHSITPSPCGRFALAADLGLDRVRVYRLDAAQGRLLPNDLPEAATHPGAGPRHLAFHPRLSVVYVINELDNTMTVFAWDAARGALKQEQVISTIPADFRETGYAADVHVAPSGRFLYGSNRGHDSIVVYRVDDRTGLLTTVAHEPAQGKWPRSFALDPAGEWLLAAHQNSDALVLFRIDAATGRLAPTGQSASIPSAVCVKFL